MTSNNAEDRYNEINKETNNILRKKNKINIKGLIEKAEQEHTTNNAKEFYIKVKFFDKGFTPNQYDMILFCTVSPIEEWSKKKL